MVEVIFTFEGIDTIIQCNANDKLEEIIDKFFIKVNFTGDKNNLYYTYNENILNNKELTFNKIANDLDKNRNKINIKIKKFGEDTNKINQIISKEIVCPNCKENIFMEIKRFRINFYGCRNNHNFDNIPLSKYEKTQKIDISKIICDICKKKYDTSTNDNDFYICYSCNKNICNLCNSKHDQDHIIINYENKNCICKLHNDEFIKYCQTCKENICIMCEKKHDNHELIKLLIKKDDILKLKDEIKKVLNNFKSRIKDKRIYSEISVELDIYNDVINNIIDNYDISKRNFHNLQNINNLKNSIEKLITEINTIIEKDNIYNIYEYIFDIFYSSKIERYVGDKKNGVKDGKGILFYDKNDPYKRKIYDGEWKNNIREGNGTMYFINDELYIGEWKKGLRIGKGIYYWNNGDRYEGVKAIGKMI